MKEYGPTDMPEYTKTFVTLQLLSGDLILKEDGHILTFTGETVAKLVRVTVDGRKVEWFIQCLKSITYLNIDLKIDL